MSPLARKELIPVGPLAVGSKEGITVLSGTLSEYQMVWIQIRTDMQSVLIWVQTVCKGYQQTTKQVASTCGTTCCWQ